MPCIAIVSAKRTPIGKFLGGLSPLSAGSGEDAGGRLGRSFAAEQPVD